MHLQAMGTHGVTLRTPPKGDLFTDFHSSVRMSTSSASDTAPPVGMPAFPGFPTGMMPMNPWAALAPWMGMSPGFGAGSVTQGSQSRKHSLPPSSDPPDMSGAIPYPCIADFLEHLHKTHPKRGLGIYADVF